MPKLAFLLHRKPNQPVIAGTTRNTSFFESQREERFLVATLLERTGIVRGAPGPPTVNCKLLTVNCALMDKLTGIHAVKEALEARRPIDRIAIAKGRQDTRVEEIVQLARKQGVPVRFEDRGQIDRLANSKDHQGVVALAAARAAATLEDILAHANGAGHGQS